jgi:hypothetical protein
VNTKEFKYDQRWSWRQANPYTMAFVYPQSHQPLIVKGGLKQVREFIDGRYIALVNYTHWYKRKFRSYHSISNFEDSYQVYHGLLIPNKWPRPLEEHDYKIAEELYHKKHWVLIVYTDVNIEVARFEFRRPPRRWLHELDTYVKMNASPKKI